MAVGFCRPVGAGVQFATHTRGFTPGYSRPPLRGVRRAKVLVFSGCESHPADSSPGRGQADGLSLARRGGGRLVGSFPLGAHARVAQ
jgi:hypothetical protein